MHRRDILLGSLGLALSGTASASAIVQQAGQKRFALILANQTYEKNPLPNIRNDALLMDKTLKGIGFTTTVVLDGTRTTMLDGIRRFKASLTPGAFVLLYYSGHGAQVDGENYLIPTDNGNLDDADAAKDQCIPLGGSNGLLEKLGRTPGQLNLIILDACRDDPFPAATKSQGSKGLAVVARPVSGDYIAMAASPGQTASANPKGMNSLYTQELVKRLATPGLRLEDVFIETRNAVVASSGGKQVPQEFGTLTAKVFLAGGASTAPNGNNNPEIKLAPTAIRLELLGVPAGATIKVDAVPLQGTIFTDEIADNTKDVEVSISAAGFRPYVGKVTLTRGSASTLRVAMERKATDPVVPVKPVVAPGGSSAPDFTFIRFDGTKGNLSDFKGKVVVLVFWATWCGPAMLAMPHLEEFWKANKNNDKVTVLAVCVWDAEDAYKKWVPANTDTYTLPFVFDPAAKNDANSIATKLYKVQAIPTTYIIDANGNVAANWLGYQKDDTRIEDTVAKLLK